MIIHVVDSWDQLLGPKKDEGGDYNCEDLHDGCKLIKRTSFWDYCKHNSWQLKSTWLLKDITPDFVSMMSHWLRATFLSFTIDIVIVY